MDELASKSVTGRFRFPVLEMDGSHITETLSIAKFFAENKLNFYGPDRIQHAKINEWIDVINF